MGKCTIVWRLLSLTQSFDKAVVDILMSVLVLHLLDQSLQTLNASVPLSRELCLRVLRLKDEAHIIKDFKESLQSRLRVVEAEMTVALFKNGAQNVRILKIGFIDGLIPHVPLKHVLAGLLLSREVLVKALPESFSLRGQLVLLGSNTIQTDQGEWLIQFRLRQELPFLVEHTDFVRFETEGESLRLARLDH